MTNANNMLKIRMLGGFAIEYQNKSLLDTSGQRPRLFLAYLLLHHNRQITRQEIAFLFWPDANESQARTNFRNLLHRLRRLFPEIDRFVQTNNTKIGWRKSETFLFDVDTFELLLSEAESAIREGNSSKAATCLGQAIETYQGDLLPGAYEEWVLSIRERLRALFLQAMETLLHLAEEKRDYKQAVRISQRWQREDPLSEAAYHYLMRFFALDGDRVNALRAYHACVSMLRQEMGVEPSDEIQGLYRRLMQQEHGTSTAIATTNADVPLVGREAAWQSLLSTWRALEVGDYQQRCELISGESGIGKTRLAEEFIAWAQRQGFVASIAHAYPAEGELPYAPLTSWLRNFSFTKLPDVWKLEVARLLPELLANHPDLSTPGPLTETWQRQRFHEGLARAILEQPQPVILFLDDIQWADRETLEWLHYLLRFDSQSRIFLLVTARSEEVNANSPLTDLITSLRQRGQFNEIVLERLTAAQTTSLASHVSQNKFSTESAEAFFRHTEGIPLFIVEMARSGLETVDASLASFPDRMRATLEQRLADLSPRARLAADAAATIGRAFAAPLLTQVSGMDETELLAALDELWQKRILREHGRDAYDFSHDKLREVVYTALTPARRHALHRHVAQALAGLDPDDLWGRAFHLEQGGQTRLAAEALFDAAKRDMDQAAYPSAQHGLAHVLLLLGDQPGRLRIEVVLSLAKVCDITGDDAQALKAVTQALELTAALEDNPLRLQALAAAGDIAYKTGRPDEARKWFEMALSAARRLGDTSHEITLLTQTGDMELRAGKAQHSKELYEQALALARQTKAHALEADALEGLGFILPAVGDSFLLARKYMEEATTIRRMMGNRLGEARSLCNFMGLLNACGAFEEALMLAPQALAKNQAVNYRRGAAIVLSGQGLAAYELGQFEQARELLESSRHEYAAIGEADGYGLHTGSMGLVAMAEGKDTEAELLFKEGLSIAEENQTDIYAAMHRQELGAVYVSQQRWGEAVLHLKKALAINIENGDNLGVVFCKTLLAQVYQATDSTQEANHLADEITKSFHEETFDGGGVVRWLWHFYQLLATLGRTEEAHETLQSAQEKLKSAAEQIHDPELKRSFEENIIHHRLVLKRSQP